MLIIRKIIHYKKPLNRKFHSIFEVGSLCKLLIVKEFTCVVKQNFFPQKSSKIQKSLITLLRLLISIW